MPLSVYDLDDTASFAKGAHKIGRVTARLKTVMALFLTFVLKLSMHQSLIGRIDGVGEVSRSMISPI